MAVMDPNVTPAGRASPGRYAQMTVRDLRWLRDQYQQYSPGQAGQMFAEIDAAIAEKMAAGDTGERSTFADAAQPQYAPDVWKPPAGFDPVAAYHKQFPQAPPPSAPAGTGGIPTATPGPVAPLPGQAPRATPGPVPPPTGVTPSKTDADANKEAIFRRTQELIGTGLPPEEALAQATQEFGGAGGAGAGGLPGGPPPPLGAGPGGLPTGATGAGIGAGPGDIADLRRELDTGSLFTAALNQQMPQGGFGPFGNYLRRQEGDLTNLYRYGQLSGDVPDPVSFKDFLGSRGGINRVDPTAFGAYATRGAGALSGPPTDENAAFREYLQADPNRQFTLASAGGMPNLAREARGYYNKAARDAFEQFRYDRPAEDFLPWYVGRGQRFF